MSINNKYGSPVLKKSHGGFDTQILSHRNYATDGTSIIAFTTQGRVGNKLITNIIILLWEIP